MSVAQTIAGVLGNITSIGLYLSSLPTFWKIFKNKSTEKFSAIPYFCIMGQSLLWLFYGTPYVQKAVLMMTINSFGVTFELVYVLVFLWYARDKKKRVETAGLLISILVATALVVSLTILLIPLDAVNNRRKMIIGILCVFVNTLTYASPLSIMWLVMKTKSTKYMPFLLSFAAFLNAILWTLYGVMGTFDIYVVIPNGTGVILTSAQLVLYACFSRRKSAEIDVELQNKVKVTPQGLDPERTTVTGHFDLDRQPKKDSVRILTVSV